MNFSHKYNKYKKKYKILKNQFGGFNEKFKLNSQKHILFGNQPSDLQGLSNCLLDIIEDNDYFKSSYSDEEIKDKIIYTIGDIHADMETLLFILRYNLNIIKPSIVSLQKYPELQNKLIPDYYKNIEPVNDYDHMVGYELTDNAINKFIVMTGDYIDGQRYKNEDNTDYDFLFCELKIHLFINQLNRLLLQNNSRLFKLSGNHDFYNMIGTHNIELLKFVNNCDPITIRSKMFDYTTDIAKNNTFANLSRVNISQNFEDTYFSSQNACLPIILDNSKIVLRLGKYLFAHGGYTLYKYINFHIDTFDIINKIIFYSILHGDYQKIINSISDKNNYLIYENTNINPTNTYSQIQKLYNGPTVTTSYDEHILDIFFSIIYYFISTCQRDICNFNINDSIIELRPNFWSSNNNSSIDMPQSCNKSNLYPQTLCDKSNILDFFNGSYNLDDISKNITGSDNTIFIVGHTPTQVINNLSKFNFNSDENDIINDNGIDIIIKPFVATNGFNMFDNSIGIGLSCPTKKSKLFYIDCMMSRNFSIDNYQLFVDLLNIENDPNKIENINVEHINSVLAQLNKKLPQTLVFNDPKYSNGYVIIPTITNYLSKISFNLILGHNKPNNIKFSLDIYLYLINVIYNHLLQTLISLNFQDYQLLDYFNPNKPLKKIKLQDIFKICIYFKQLRPLELSLFRFLVQYIYRNDKNNRNLICNQLH